MWPFSITTPEIKLPDSSDGTSTARLVVILGGTALIIFGTAYLLKNLYPFFDDLHESKSEADSDDSDSDDSDDSDDHHIDDDEDKILREILEKEGEKPNMTLFGFH